jgi:gamma-glutamyl-gamma-aminobutyrate hydrolase PuuD
MKKINIFIVGDSLEYANWMLDYTLVDKLEDADLVVFTGGEDVNPKYYNSIRHWSTSYNDNRDKEEIIVYNKALALNKNMIGICRGSQFLCVMNGGELVQDQPNPNYIHEIKTTTKKILVTSTHHQAAYPFKLKEEDYKIIGWTENMLTYHVNGNDEELNPEKECEIVYYPKTKCLGIQSHPEMIYPPKNNLEHTSIEYMRELLTNFLENKL